MNIAKKSIVISNDGSTVCSKKCPYSRACANHTSAGDYRMEGGFSPYLAIGKNAKQVICWSKHSILSKESTFYGGNPEPSNASTNGFVDYDDIPNHESIDLDCWYCKDSNTFTVSYDTESHDLVIKCSDCKAKLKIDDHPAIKAFRKANLRSVVSEISDGMPPITQEEMDAVTKAWKTPNEK